MTEQKNTQTHKRHIAVTAASRPFAPRSAAAIPNFDELPDSALLRQSQLVRHPKHPIRPVLLPFSAATFWRRVRNDPDFPQPVNLGGRITAWRAGDVRAWIAAQEGGM